MCMFSTSKDIICAFIFSLDASIPLLDFLAEMVSALYNTSILPKWKKFGILLKLSPASLNAIGHNNLRDVHMCLVEMLALWLQSAVDPPPSWNTVIDAIRRLGEQELADELTTNKLTGVVIVS